MGYIRHEAIVVTAFDIEHLERARSLAIEAGLPVSERVPSPVNSYQSFFVAPDGSKEGWVDSDRYEVARASFIKAMRSDEQLYCDWVLVSFGGDANTARIEDHGDNVNDDEDSQL